MVNLGSDYPENILYSSTELGKNTRMGRGELSNVDMDAFARRLTREHNKFVGTPGFLIAWVDRPRETVHMDAGSNAFPNDSYVLPILSTRTTARDVLLWITGRMGGKHADRELWA